MQPMQSNIRWVKPPQPGQPLEELEWCWIDVYQGDNGLKALIRETPPSPEEVSMVIDQLRPHFPLDVGWRTGLEERPREELIHSMVHWLVPPEIGQPLGELEWCWIDLYAGPGKCRRGTVREERPCQEKIEEAIMIKRPFSSRVGRAEDREQTPVALIEAWITWNVPLV